MKKFTFALFVFVLASLMLTSCSAGLAETSAATQVVAPESATQTPYIMVITATPAATAIPTLASTAIVNATNQVCPNTTADAKKLFGIDVQRIDTEPCAWVWRGKPMSHTAICPTGYVCTWDVVNDITVVSLGIDQSADIYAGTFRLISAYPAGDAVYDVCELYIKEKDFGQREDNSFEVRFQSVPNIGPQSCPLP